jgi:hypothetical protein
VSPRLIFFGMSWHCTYLTCVTIWMTCDSSYMTWPNDGLTHGSMEDNWTCMEGDMEGDWACDCAVWMTCGRYDNVTCGRYSGDVAMLTG